jgi:hypothetical protein
MERIRSILWHSCILSMASMLILSACGGGGTPTSTAEPQPTETPIPSPTSLPNIPPEIITLAGSPREICPGELTELVAVVMDADGDPISYVWTSEVGTISNPSEDANGGRADYQGSALPGEDSVELTVSDGKGGVHKSQTSIKVRGDCEPIVRITTPRDILTCSADTCLFEVKGSTSSVISRSDFGDLRLYVLVFPINPPGAGWYIQLQPGSIQSSDGLWSQSPSWLGSVGAPEETGHTLKIVAVIVSTDAIAKTINGTRTIDQMTGNNNDNIVRDPRAISATFLFVSNEVNLTVQK